MTALLLHPPMCFLRQHQIREGGTGRDSRIRHGIIQHLWQTAVGLNRDFFNEINSEILRAVWHIPQSTKHLYLYKIKGVFTQSNFLFQHQSNASEGLLEGGTLQEMCFFIKKMVGSARNCI